MEMKKLGLLIILIAVFTTSLLAYDGYVDITNETGFTIYYVFISHVSDEFWGDDNLGRDIIIQGDTHRFFVYDRPSSEFDIQIEDVDGDLFTITGIDLAVNNEITFTLDDLDPAESEFVGEVTIEGPGGKINGYIDIVNRTGFDVYYIYMRQDQKEWSEDVLGNWDVLFDLGRFTVNLIDFPYSVFDVKLEDEKKNTYTFYSVDIYEQNLVVELKDQD
jgi:hypothetical protein